MLPSWDSADEADLASGPHPGLVHFDLLARSIRRQHPWLLEDLVEADHSGYLHPTEGAILFHGLRTDPESGEQVLAGGATDDTTIPRMEDETIVERPDTGGAGGQSPTSAANEITLTDGTGAIWVRSR